MPVAKINGFNTHYDTIGNGVPIVFIHGGYGGASSSVYPRDLMDWADPLTDRYSVISYDRRSSGKSEYPQVDYTLDDLSKDLDSLLDHLKIDKAFLLGSSAGGPVALTYALDHQDRLYGLVLANTSSRMWMHEARIQAREKIRNRMKILNELGPVDAYQWIEQEQRGPGKIVMAPGGPGPRPPDRAGAMIERAKVVQALISKLDERTKIKYVVGELRNQYAYIDSDLTDRLDEIEIPTLVIHGDADGQVPYYLGWELSGLIRNSELVTVSGAGHGVMNWAGSVEALKSFCDRLKPLQQ